MYTAAFYACLTSTARGQSLRQQRRNAAKRRAGCEKKLDELSDRERYHDAVVALYKTGLANTSPSSCGGTSIVVHLRGAQEADEVEKKRNVSSLFLCFRWFSSIVLLGSELYCANIKVKMPLRLYSTHSGGRIYQPLL